MASQLTLDRSDAGVDEMVSAWKDGGTYRVMLEITQTGSSPNVATFDVTGVTNESEEAAQNQEVETQSPPAAKKAAAPPVTVAY